ncbi:beta-lactamase-like protein [Aspergillus carlsbadensis]|nr:beta-lactamase-like protein [Aspergillus carlsbadensis]
MAAIQSQLERGAVPNAVSNVCPEGTKFHGLEVGWLECDEAFVVRGSNSSLKSTENKSFVNKRRELPMYCILIEHPHESLILWETGCGKDYPEIWGPVVSDIFARIRYEPQHELRAAVEATGNRIEDIKKIIIGHLHLDHAGGLDEFFDNKDVEIWVHERELNGAFWCVATGADAGVYLEHYLKHSLNLKTFNDQTMDFINMPETGTFFFVSDHCHVMENWKDGIPQGWLARDHPAWFRSTQRLKQLMRVTKGQMIPGHDKETFLALQDQAKVFT